MQELPTERLKRQFDIIGDTENNPIIVEYIPPKIEGKSITYRNDVIQDFTRRSLKSQKYFNYIKQYIAFFRSKSYQFLFSDYSLGRMVYEFDTNNKLISYNVYWNPCPFNKEFIESINELGIDFSEFLDELDEKEKIELDSFSLKSPMRFDYSCKYDGTNKDFHPSLHVHCQDSETRMRTSSVFSIYKYFLFVLENCFPDIYRDKKYSEYIDQIRVLEKDSSQWLKIQSCEKGDQIKTEIEAK